MNSMNSLALESTPWNMPSLEQVQAPTVRLNNHTRTLTSLTVKEKQEYILKNLGYSNNLVLHTCPKKFQLTRLSGQTQTDESAGSVTFAFGHAVGAAIQTLLIPGKTIHDAQLAALMAWDIPLSEELPAKKKSFWYVLKAIDAAVFLVQDLHNDGWELAFFDGIPGVEYSFILHLPDGFRYNAHIDIILYNSRLKKYRIVEVKTSGYSNVHEAVFGNSSQALSYAIALDYLVKHQTSYDVLYLVWSCPAMEWVMLPFSKSVLVKAEWIRDILYDIETVKNLLRTNYFPKRGENCYAFFRPCEFYGICGYSEEYLGVNNHKTLDSIIQRELSNTKIDKNNKRGYDVEIQFIDLLKDRLLMLEGASV